MKSFTGCIPVTCPLDSHSLLVQSHSCLFIRLSLSTARDPGVLSPISDFLSVHRFTILNLTLLILLSILSVFI